MAKDPAARVEGDSASHNPPSSCDAGCQLHSFYFDTEWLTQVQVFDNHRVRSRPGDVRLVHRLRIDFTAIRAGGEGREEERGAEGTGGGEKEDLWHPLLMGRRFSLKQGWDQLWDQLDKSLIRCPDVLMNFLGGFVISSSCDSPQGPKTGTFPASATDSSKTPPPHPWIVSAHWSSRKLDQCDRKPGRAWKQYSCSLFQEVF